MYQDAIESVRDSIFPIFFKARHEGAVQLGVSGTGFFITDDGHFLTACHVITDTPCGSKIFYVGNVPSNPLDAPMEIEEVARDEQKDLFVGRVPDGGLPALSFLDEAVRPGKSVSLSGYPLSRLSQNPDGSIDVFSVRPFWQPTFVLDGLSVDVNNREYRGYMTQHTSLRGMSGGPVFDMTGGIVGMDVATLTRKITAQDGRETIIPNGVVVSVERIRELVDDLGLDGL